MSFVNTFQQVTAGNTASTVASFTLPATMNVSGGNIAWDLLDADGLVYASGVGTAYSFTPVAQGVRVTANISVTTPSNIPTNEIGTAYQVRFILTLVSGKNFINFTTLNVLPAVSVQQGSESLVVMVRDGFDISIVLPNTYATVSAQIFNGNNQINNVTYSAGVGVPTSDGYRYTVTIPQNTFTQASLSPFSIIWSYANGGQPSREIGKVFVVNPSILMAAEDLQDEINKARSHLGYKPVFSTEEMLTYLRIGADRFNGYANVTKFTMTNATGPVRAFWLSFSKIVALRSQYMAEGEAAFDFQGQSVSLQVDRTQFYETLASAEENAINDPARQFKAILSKRGQIAGDGNVDPTALNFGAIACVGVGLSPVSNLRPFSLPTWLGGIRLY